MIFIEEVEDVFDISGRGCVIVPGIPHSFKLTIGVGAELEFQNPSGSIIRAKLSGIEMINRGKPMKHTPFSVNRDVKKGDIEIGSKLFLVKYEQKT